MDEERQELQTLVSDISHQVKTPVSNLKMATDTLLEKPMTEAERTDFIRGIRSQTDKLDFLFQALVKTSRLETGVIQLDKKPGRPGSLLHSAEKFRSLVRRQTTEYIVRERLLLHHGIKEATRFLIQLDHARFQP